MNNDCKFCQIILDRSSGKQSILHETDRTITILSNPRLMKGHVLVIPKKHVSRFGELDEGEVVELMKETIRVENILLKRFSGCDISQHFRPFIPDSKFKVTHLHIHIRPRELNDELYMKVQRFERDVFSDIDPSEVMEWKKMLE